MQSMEPKRKEQESGKGRPIPQTENPDRENQKNRNDPEEDVNYEEENDQESEEQDDEEVKEDDEEEDDEVEQTGAKKRENLNDKLERLDLFNEHSPKREDVELGIVKSGSSSPSRPKTGSSDSRGNSRNDNNGRKGPGTTTRDEGKKKGNTKDGPAANKKTVGPERKSPPAKGLDKKGATKNISQVKKSSSVKGKTGR